jgi:hypothetical protein
MKPKDLWDSNPEFQKYRLSSFRGAFNKRKSDMGVHVQDEGEFGSEGMVLL